MQSASTLVQPKPDIGKEGEPSDARENYTDKGKFAVYVLIRRIFNGDSLCFVLLRYGYGSNDDTVVASDHVPQLRIIHY